MQGDLIWSYGNCQPRLTIPKSITSLMAGYQFLGVAGEKSIKAPFLDCLKINYDFNHALATHCKPFKFETIEVNNYQKKDYYTSLDQKIIRANNTIRELIVNPALITVQKVLHNHFEYFFSTITCVIADTLLEKLMQLFVLYPESDRETKTKVLVYLQPKNIFTQYLSLLTKNSFILFVREDPR